MAALIEVNERQEGTESSIGRNSRTWTKIFSIETDDKIDAKVHAENQMAGLGITPGSFLVTSTGAVDKTRTVDNVRFKVVDGKTGHVIATVTYRQVSVNANDNEDPVDDEPEISVSSIETEEPIYLDIDGNPIENSACEGFDPPLTENIDDTLVTIVANETDAGLLDFLTFKARYNNKLNADSWLGLPARSALLKVNGVRSSRAGKKFWRVTYEILIREPVTFTRKEPTNPPDTTDFVVGLDRMVPDEGFKTVRNIVEDDPGSGTECVEATDPNGRVVNSPVRLNGAGVKQAEGDPPYIHVFKTKNEVAFAPLFDPLLARIVVQT